MRLHVVSDVHGRADALAKAGDGADALICLGDLIGFLDYDDHGSGIMGSLFGAEAVGRLVALRTASRYQEAREFSRSLWAGRESERMAVLEAAVRAQYAELFAAFPTPTYLTYGNVDIPHLYADYARDGVTVLDGEVVTLGGLTFGFVGGGLQTPMHTPFEISDEAYAEKVAAVGAVDVLCTHLPPHLPGLLYDVRGQRFERGSVAVLEAIQRTQPRYAIFGHVHSPLQRSVRIGRTECINVGHFQASGRPYVLDL